MHVVFKMRQNRPSVPAADTNRAARRSALQEAEDEAHAGNVTACPQKIRRIIRNRGTNILSLSKAADLSRGWLYKVLKGEEVRRNKLEELADFFEVPLTELLPGVPLREEDDDFSAPRNWQIEAYLSAWRTIPNGVSYRTNRLRHELVHEKVARGKIYDLQHIEASRREAMTEYLARHAKVCTLVGEHPFIFQNLDVRRLPDSKGWWVLDQWIDGQSLEDEVSENPDIERGWDVIRPIGRDILLGLQVLHEHDIIFRDLSPDKVWVTDGGKHCRLTDFEMAKLGGGAPSVSGRWDWGYFRAPECNDYQAEYTSDLYSWAKIMTWYAAGGRMVEKNWLKGCALPTKVRQLLERCWHPLISKRPTRVSDVLQIWNNEDFC